MGRAAEKKKSGASRRGRAPSAIARSISTSPSKVAPVKTVRESKVQRSKATSRKRAWREVPGRLPASVLPRQCVALRGRAVCAPLKRAARKSEARNLHHLIPA